MLVAAAEGRLRSEGVEYLQVKTLSASARDKPYLEPWPSIPRSTFVSSKRCRHSGTQTTPPSS